MFKHISPHFYYQICQLKERTLCCFMFSLIVNQQSDLLVQYKNNFISFQTFNLEGISLNLILKEI